MKNDVRFVVGYYLDQACDDSRPLGVLLALCRLYWPDRTMCLREGSKGDDGLYYTRDLVDADTGERADRLLPATKEVN
jgi:hypothetical protein